MSDDLSPVPAAAEARVVARWVEAHNERDLEAMLACATEDIEVSPLRLAGGPNLYAGHDGLRLWFAQFVRSEPRHEIHVRQIQRNGTDEVLVTGSVDVPGSSPVAEFYGVYEISDGLIARAHHWMSDRRTMESLGLIQPIR